jgi:TorA-specific chaperone
MGSKATVAMARSILWQAVSLGLRPPTPLTRLRLASPEGLEPLERAAALVSEALVPHVRALGAAPAPSAETHARLFGHTSPGLVPPYETEWGKDDLFGKHRLADLAGLLAAFGLRLDRAQHERVDHVSCEAELAAFLAAREARALDDGDAAAGRVAIEAQRLLLGEHLGAFAPAFARALAREDPAGFYGRLGELLLGLVLAECAAARVQPGDPTLGPRATDLDDHPLECGPATDLVQIRGATPAEAEG